MSTTDENPNTQQNEYTVIIPRFSAPNCIVSCKSDLQQEIQQKTTDLPKYSYQSYGEPHSLRWSSTIQFKNGSTISVAPIYKSKKDADRVVAYKTMKIGVDKVMNEVIVQNADFDVDIGMTLKLFEESGLEKDAVIESAYKAGQYKNINPKSLIPTVLPTTTTTTEPFNPSSITKPETMGYTRREFNMDGHNFVDSEGHLELPFIFPISSDDTDIVFSIAERCLKNETQRRQIFAYGRFSTWRVAWMRCLPTCIANRGVIICSPEIESLVVESLKTYIDQKNIVYITAPGMEVEPPTPCVINSDVLKHINLNKIFPTERPILLIDSSIKWAVTWQLMVFLPTFHITSYCLYESDASSPVIQINMLRDVYNCDLLTQI